MSTRKRAGARLRGAHTLQLLQDGGEYFDSLIEAIDQSRREIRLETYIFRFDVVGLRVAAALESAALRGVRTYISIDGFGTPAIPPEWEQRFRASGVSWRIFLPFGRIGLFLPVRWRRLHRKLCVLDGAVAYCGGFNVLDDFFDPNHGPLKEPRLDFAVRVTGPLVDDVLRVMTRFWWRQTAAADVRDKDLPAAWRDFEASLQAGPAQPIRDNGMPSHASDQASGDGASGPQAYAELVLRDNLRNRRKIERAYLKAIGVARHEVIISNAYFLPGARLRRALVHASRRGVRVRLLLQGRYEYFLQYHATRALYGKLLEAGVEIHEYTASFLHAKVAVIDSQWATVGSSNLDPLSLLLAREANLVMDDAGFATRLHERLEAAIRQGSAMVDARILANRPWQQRALEALASLALRAGILVLGRRY